MRHRWSEVGSSLNWYANFMTKLYCISNVNTIVKQTETVTFRLTPEEKETLLKYCELTARTQSDVFREFLRTLQKRLSNRGVLNPPL
jgi:hypothetical protein